MNSKNPAGPLAEGILLTPMLVKLSPGPIREIVGSLNQREPLLESLGLAAR